MEQRSTPVRLSDSFGKGEKQRTIARDISESLGKLPPQDLAMEEAVLGAILLQKDALQEVPFLQPSHFYIDQHKEIYQAALDLARDSQPVDMRTVIAQLRKNGKVEIAGGAFYIAELTSKVSSSAHIQAHARIIIEHSIKRDLIQIASQIHHEAYEDTTDVFNLLDKSESSIIQLGTTTRSETIIKMKDALYEMVKDIQSRTEDSRGITGVPSGFDSLDRITHGWQNSDLIIMAARPGMGKTSCVLSALRNAAVDFNIPVAIVSLEMARIQLVRKLSSIETELSLKKLKNDKFNQLDWQQLTDKTAKLASSPFYIMDPSSMSIMEFISAARQMKSKYGVKMIALDYLQLMKGEKEAKNREQEIASITRGLKRAAKELDIPIIALAQLSREVEKRGGAKIPQLSDLRESGSIEQDSDLVCFLWRPEYYKIDGDDSGTFTQGVTKFIVAKHRNGSINDAYLTFIGHTTAFKNCEHIYTHTAPPEGFVPVPKNEPAPKSIEDDAPF